MKFGQVATAGAAGAILAHSVQANGLRLGKGRVLGTADIDALLAAGIAEITVAEPEADDLHEDEAAQIVAEALRGINVSLSEPVAGRVNLIADVEGLLHLQPARVLAVNRIDESITLATRPQFARMHRGLLLATVKIIPYAAPRRAVEAAALAAGSEGLWVIPFRAKSYDLILTRTPGFKDSLIAKGRAAVQARADALGWRRGADVVVDHAPEAVTGALAESSADVVLILGASATSDRRDVIPASLTAAGGEVDRLGMPADPGNLLMLGRRGEQVVIGLPGCARAPALNGADWVMERIAADLPVTDEDFAVMGLGGLLKEIPERIQPRALQRAEPQRISAVLLAAGSSSRMRGENKLLREIDGVPLLRRSAETLLASGVRDCIAVIPANAPAHRTALDGLPMTIVEAADAGLGMSASLRAGVATLPKTVTAALVALADMPDLTASDVDRIIAGYDPDGGALIVCPVDGRGRRGHPVLFDQRYFENLQNLTGDRGAREILQAVPEAIREVRLGAGVTCDLDTPEQWADWEGSSR